MSRLLAIIPARYGSSRLPGKPLADLVGMTMIGRVYHQVRKAVDNVWVATDDIRIYDEVRRFGGNAVMTASDHSNGTSRILEAIDKIEEICPASVADDTVVLNVQGDEPFVSPDEILLLADVLTNIPSADIATLITPFDPDNSTKALDDPSLVKVVVGSRGQALWFSRAVIPMVRKSHDTPFPLNLTYFTHIGMYAYRLDALKIISQLSPTPAETAESLEQLRWLENGMTVMTAVTNHQHIGIDTPADLLAARQSLQYQSRNNVRP